MGAGNLGIGKGGYFWLHFRPLWLQWEQPARVILTEVERWRRQFWW